MALSRQRLVRALILSLAALGLAALVVALALSGRALAGRERPPPDRPITPGLRFHNLAEAGTGDCEKPPTGEELDEAIHLLADYLIASVDRAVVPSRTTWLMSPPSAS